MSEWTRDIDADERDFTNTFNGRPPAGKAYLLVALQYIARVRELTAELDRLRGEIAARYQPDDDTARDCKCEERLEMNTDPTMPTLTLGLSEWREGQYRDRWRYWTCGDYSTSAAHITYRCVRVNMPGGCERRTECNDIEDGMRKADAMLREWIKGVPQ